MNELVVAGRSFSQLSVPKELGSLSSSLSNGITVPRFFLATGEAITAAERIRDHFMKRALEAKWFLFGTLMMNNQNADPLWAMGVASRLLPYRLPPLLDAAAMSKPDIRNEILDRMTTAADGLSLSIANAQDHLVAGEQVGLLELFPNKVVKYNFFRSHKEQQTSERSYWDRTERDLTTIFTKEHHVHELYDTRIDPLPADHVQKPRKVKEFINIMDKRFAWLRPHLRVVSGMQFSEQIFTRTRTTTRTEVEVRPEAYLVNRPDPALCFGPYVLTGWTDPNEPYTTEDGVARLHKAWEDWSKIEAEIPGWRQEARASVQRDLSLGSKKKQLLQDIQHWNYCLRNAKTEREKQRLLCLIEAGQEVLAR